MIRMYKTNFKNSCKSNSLYLVHREDPDPLNPRQSSNNLNLQKPSSQSSTTSKTQIKNPSKLERKWDQLSQLTPKLSLLFFNINAQMHHSHITKKTAKKTQKKKALACLSKWRFFGTFAPYKLQTLHSNGVLSRKYLSFFLQMEVYVPTKYAKNVGATTESHPLVFTHM